jgi:hypothetical protein
VTDSTGRSATATASLFVAEPSPPPPIPKFAGVTIARQTIRASKKGVVTVKVKCPGVTAGSCAGTLKLASTSEAFSIKPGATGKVTAKLPKATLKKLRRNGRLNLTATAQAHDVNGSSKKTTGKITLLRPR